MGHNNAPTAADVRAAMRVRLTELHRALRDGMLRYWDGTAWTDHYAPKPASVDPSSATWRRRAQVVGTVAVALIVCFVLVALVWGNSVDVLIDDSQSVVTITQSAR